MTTFKPYLIQCLTNIHVGSGDTTYGVIDKLVQRDPVTGYPNINSSSLKGALREHFEKKNGWGKTDERIVNIFGSESRNGADSQTGSYKFLNGDLLALPVRCTHKQFVHAFDKTIIEQINNRMKMLTNSLLFEGKFTDENVFYTNDSPLHIYAEDCRLERKPFISPFAESSRTALSMFNRQYALIKSTNFDTFSKKLPIIARNNIENGTSQNLWYEEIVPHQTLFITYIGFENIINGFEDGLLNDVVQIGANATIGYGLCKFSSLV